MKQIETKIVIKAPREKVWSVLTDFDSYANWNPFIIRGSGNTEVGSQLDLTMKNGKKEMGFTPEVQISDQNYEFEWLGSGMGGTFKGRHYFRLADTDEGTELVHGEKFSGLLSGLILAMIKSETTKGFESMNLALKEKVENQ